MHSTSLRRAPKSSTLSHNNKRIYWAVIRIIIALTSSGFFTYFLVGEVLSFMDVDNINQSVLLSASIVDWLRASADEEETTTYLLQNITVIPPDPYSPNPSSPRNISFAQLQITQQGSLALLRGLLDSTQANGFLRSKEEADLFSAYVTQVYASQKQTNLYLQQLQTSFSWDYYFNLTDLSHGLRLFLTDIVARNINFENQRVAMYSVALTAVLYYRETLAQLRDAVLEYARWPTNDSRDTVIERKKAKNVYLREVTQKLPSELLPLYVTGTSFYLWQHCNRSLEDTVSDIRNASFDVFFNATQWFTCCAVLLHELRTVRNGLIDNLMRVMTLHVKDLEASMTVAFVGIALEMLAAGALIYQAIPVLLLFAKMRFIVRVSTTTTTAPPQQHPSTPPLSKRENRNNNSSSKS